jgi:hypothetical protein
MMEKLYSKKITKASTSSATQQYLDIAEIKDDVIVLKNGSFRSVLAVSAVNFDLKSTQEQTAIIEQYQNFLNSIDFPIQILISSRKLNPDKYLDFISEKEKIQSNELLKLQISEYKNFIQQLVSVSNIMDKNFYIVIPFSPIESKEKSFISNLIARLNPQKNILEKRSSFETYKSQLYQRVDHIAASLSGIGVSMIPLKTQELIELMFNSYNPSADNKIDLVDVNTLEIS